GKKFNARKERVEGEHYLGIQKFRFYIRCPRCSTEITFKTDPQNGDYTAELGAMRNFEPWRDETAVDEEKKAERAEAEENNPMKALENRTLDSKREMDILDALDEIRTRNARSERVDADAALGALMANDEARRERARKWQEEEDER
ncbi:CWC16 protein, partial [Blyttiomyces helicus]